MSARPPGRDLIVGRDFVVVSAELRIRGISLTALSRPRSFSGMYS